MGGDSDGMLIQGNVLSNPGFSGIAVPDTLQMISGAANVDVLGKHGHGRRRQRDRCTADDFAAVLARNNVLRNNGIDGIYFGPATNGNQIRTSTATGNANLDCEDDSVGGSTAGTANTWVGNNGVTDDPNGICP